MFNTKFGIEIEFTGIPRNVAAHIVATHLNGTSIQRGGETYEAIADDGRVWKLVYDGSIDTQERVDGHLRRANSIYSVELVSPILTYDKDITILQGLVRKLRVAGGFVNNTCGIHIHLDGSNHTPRSLRNFINLVASRNDLFYKAFQIPVERMRYCKQMDEYLVKQLNRLKPNTFEFLKRIWYMGYKNEPQYYKYHHSRYHFLNLHSYFNGHGTVELRGFNSTLHAGKVRAYAAFALAMNHQALTQKSAHYRKVQSENEKFAMRVYLVRIGLSGKKFKNCRKHLYEHLSGNSAWRYGSKEECRSRRKKPDDYIPDEDGDDHEELELEVFENYAGDTGNKVSDSIISDILKQAEIRCLENE